MVGAPSVLPDDVVRKVAQAAEAVGGGEIQTLFETIVRLPFNTLATLCEIWGDDQLERLTVQDFNTQQAEFSTSFPSLTQEQVRTLALAYIGRLVPEHVHTFFTAVEDFIGYPLSSRIKYELLCNGKCTDIQCPHNLAEQLTRHKEAMQLPEGALFPDAKAAYDFEAFMKEHFSNPESPTLEAIGMHVRLNIAPSWPTFDPAQKERLHSAYPEAPDTLMVATDGTSETVMHGATGTVTQYQWGEIPAGSEALFDQVRKRLTERNGIPLRIRQCLADDPKLLEKWDNLLPNLPEIKKEILTPFLGSN